MAYDYASLKAIQFHFNMRLWSTLYWVIKKKFKFNVKRDIID